jgi:FkbM family methyltransferase
VGLLRFLRKYSYYLFSVFEILVGFDNPILLTKIFLGLVTPGGEMIRLRKHGLRFKVRGAMDVWSIKETFLDGFYEKYGFPIQPDWKIIDIGAGIGDYTLFAAMAQPNVKVFSFEPYPESFALMQENLRLNAITNAQIFDTAISATSGELILDLTSGEPLQIQSYPEPEINNKTTLPVHSLSLVDAFTELGLGSCDLLKLDCEGAEYAILFGTSRSVLERIAHIVMEYHDGLTAYDHRELISFLNERGFQIETFPNPVHPHLGYLRALRKN